MSSDGTQPASKATESTSAGFNVRRLLAMALPEWRRLVPGTLFLVISSAAGLYFPQVAREILDASLEAESRTDVDRAALLLALAFIIQGVAGALRYMLFTEAGEHIVTRLRGQIFDALLRHDIAFFDERRTGELLSRISNDASILQNTVSVNVSMALRNGLTVIGGLVLLWLTSARLTLIMVTVIPAVVLGAIFFGRLVRRLSYLAQEELAGATAQAEEALSGIRNVRSFAQEPWASERYDQGLRGYFDTIKKSIRWMAVFTGTASIAGYLSIAIVVWYGGRLVLDGSLSAGDLTQFILYTLLVAVSVGMLGSLYGDFMKARGAAQRVFEIVDATPTIPLTGGHVLPAVRGDLEFKDVHFAYPTRPDAKVLKGIDLEVRAGQVVALVGESGAGKSTIAALVRRFYDIDSGEISLDGHDIRTLDPSALREHIGTVDQEPVLLSASIAENIGFGAPDASDEAVRDAAAQANALDFVTDFPKGFETVVGERGAQLSGGQKQRIAIARALLKDPQILIFDEATSALDAESEYQVQQALDRLMIGRTVILIAHRLSTIMGAHRVYVLGQGKVIEYGEPAALIDQGGAFQALVERQRLVESPLEEE